MRGFNGFSYADIAAELGITRPACTTTSPARPSSGEALIERYAARFVDALADDRRGAAATRAAKLAAYASIYADVLRDQRMCLCGMLAADYDTLPDPMRDAVVRFFDRERGAGSSAVLEQGEREGRSASPARRAKRRSRSSAGSRGRC